MEDHVKLYNVPLWDSPVFIMEKDAVNFQGEAAEVRLIGGSATELMF
jgi:hypothetical protein